MCKEHNKRIGSALEHGQAHTQEHQLWSRRDFLSASGLLGAGSLLLGKLPVKAFQPSPLLAELAGSQSDRILVLIRLDGGNDGLNTVINRGNTDYYNLRPNIALADNNLWALSDDFGMPLSTNAVQPMWEEGQMKVLHNVGYPDPNYSHFRSFDIVASGSDSQTVWNSGWIGRFMDNQFPAFLQTPPTVPPALQIGVQTNLIFRADSGTNMALAVNSPEEFYQIAATGQLYDLGSLGTSPRELELAYVRQTANAAFRYAETIKTAYSRGQNAVDYPQSNTGGDLDEQMAIVARLIKGNLGTKIYMVEIGGFDTHANQEEGGYHQALLNKIATSVKAFFDDLAAANNGLPEKVLAMTFSEFGRTIYENDSGGTDHGAGTPILLFGGGIGNGFTGTYQDLTNPDPYIDPEFSVDFRDVYATILQDWLGNSPELVNFVMGKEHPRINGLVPALAPPLGSNGDCLLLGHNPDPAQVGSIEIKYSMLQDGNVRLQIVDPAGQVLRTLVNEFQRRGSYNFKFRPALWLLAPGNYRYRLQAGGKVFQREINVG